MLIGDLDVGPSPSKEMAVSPADLILSVLPFLMRMGICLGRYCACFVVLVGLFRIVMRLWLIRRVLGDLLRMG